MDGLATELCKVGMVPEKSEKVVGQMVVYDIGDVNTVSVWLLSRI